MTDAALVDDPTEAAADHAVIETLLRCWVRELDVVLGSDELTLPLASGTVVAPVTFRSATGWHRFGAPRLDGAPMDSEQLVTALAAELETCHGLVAHRARDLIERTLGSRDRIADHAGARAGHALPMPPSFLHGEQELVAGHPFHPAAKSREDLGPGELLAYSPELRGSFPIRWVAVHRDLVVTGSSLAHPAEALLADLEDAPEPPRGTVPLPLHPWQARAILGRPDVAPLVEAGAVRDLGDGAHRWHPTSSLRTVWRDGAPWMLKLSLGLRLTNSRRENRRDELRLGVQARRLLAGGLGAELAVCHPRFRIVSDPAWVAADVGRGGFETAIRENPFRGTDRSVCVATLVDERPGCGPPLLVRLVRRLAERARRSSAAVAEEWLRRYVREVVVPLAWLDAAWGIVLEAHHQNTLVVLDADGWPAGGWYRDNQGWYVGERAERRLSHLVPGLMDDLGAVFPDELVARRGAYYLGVNNLLGIVGALGAGGVADEATLLAAARADLGAVRGSPVIDLLLHAPRLPCKANLLTCADGRDELETAVEHQSVYVEIPNPLVGGPW